MGPMDVVMSQQQEQALGDRSPVVVVLGGPGTGRTTVCLERAARFVESGGDLSEVLLLAHSRSAAQDLRARLLARLGGAHLNPRVTTVHALARSIVLSAHDPRTPVPRLLTAPEQEFRIRELIDARGLDAWPAGLRAAAGTSRFVSDVRVMAATIRQHGLDPADLSALGRSAGRSDWQVLGQFLDEYLDVLDLEGGLDYAEAVHRARIALTDPAVLASLTSSTALVVCDDLTECDRSQSALLADLARAGVPTLLTACPEETIFAFRGAQSERLDEVLADFPDPAVHRLDIDRRCGAGVHEVVERLRDALPVEPVAALRRVPSTAVGPGTAELLTASSQTRLARRVAERLRAAHLRRGVPWEQMAVVTRHGRDLGVLVTVLGAEGIPVHRSRDDVVLWDVHAVRHVLAVLDLCADLSAGTSPRAESMAAVLAGPMSGLDQATRHRLEEWAVHHGLTLDWDGLEGLLLGPRDDDAPRLPAGLARRVRPGAVLLARMRRAADDLSARVAAHDALWRLWDGSDWSRELRARALAGDATADGELDGLCSLFDLAERADTLVGASGARRLVRSVREEEIPADRARESDQDRRGVSVMTAHRSKGLEFEVVVVCGLEDGVWPAPDHTGSLVGVDEWSPVGPVARPGWGTTVAAERRLLLVACSRARSLLVLASVDDPESGVGPSPFLTSVADLAVDARPEADEREHPAGLGGLVGQLRRSLTDPTVSVTVRRYAARTLCSLAERTDAGVPLVPQADPRRWWRDGVAGAAGRASRDPAERPEVTLSPSHVGELLTCPRRWFVTRRLGASGPDTVASSLGTLVHDIAATRATSWNLEEAVAELEDRWDEVLLEVPWQGPVELESGKEALARLDRWLEGRPGTVVGTEVPVDVVLDLPSARVRVRGTIDRLEEDDEGRLHVVDIKTGRSTSPLVARSHEVQIAVYQAAVRAGGCARPDAAGKGPVDVGGAELVHLLRGAGRGGVDPKVVRQPSLDDVPWPPSEYPTPVPGCASWIEARIDEAAAVALGSDLRAVPNQGCGTCPARAGCPALVPPDPAVDRATDRGAASAPRRDENGARR